MKRKNMIILIILLIAALGMSAISYFGIDAPEHGLNKTLSAENIKKGLDLSGGVYIVYQAKDSEGNLMSDPSGDDMSAASQLLRTRLDLSGWTDGEVSIEGGNRLRVEIPGIDNAEEAIKGIGQAGVLAFLDETGNVVVSGDKVANASVGISDSSTGKAGYYCINLEFNSEGAGDFKTATENNIGKPIYITLDGVPLSWPTVQNVIPNGRATITGEFGKEEATTLANLINSWSGRFEHKFIRWTCGYRSRNYIYDYFLQSFRRCR